MTKENSDKQNVFNQVRNFFSDKKIFDKNAKSSPKSSPNTSSSNSETDSSLRLDLQIERKLNRPYQIGEKFVILTNFPRYNVFKGNICTLSEIYFDWKKYTQNDGHSYIVQVLFISSDSEMLDNSDSEMLDDTVMLCVEYDDLLRLEYENLVEISIPENELERKNLKF